MPDRPEIVVREVAGEIRVGVRGLEAIEHDTEELRAFVEEDKEALIALHEAEAAAPPEQHWLIGRAIAEYANDDAVLEDLLAATGYEKTHELTASERFYRAFPGGDIPSEWAWSPIREFFTHGREKFAREAIQRAVEHDRQPRVYEVRTIDRCHEREEFSVEAVVKELLQASPSQIGSKPTDETISRAATTVRVMAGIDNPYISPEEVAIVRSRRDNSR